MSALSLPIPIDMERYHTMEEIAETDVAMKAFGDASSHVAGDNCHDESASRFLSARRLRSRAQDISLVIDHHAVPWLPAAPCVGAAAWGLRRPWGSSRTPSSSQPRNDALEARALVHRAGSRSQWSQAAAIS
ncbi:hypothetical protein PINS_up003634 [Pythium insidiosum]|nr:hypothetical protein PINS_up003634 [Pythium insidiosum]